MKSIRKIPKFREIRQVVSFSFPFPLENFSPIQGKWPPISRGLAKKNSRGNDPFPLDWQKIFRGPLGPTKMELGEMTNLSWSFPLALLDRPRSGNSMEFSVFRFFYRFWLGKKPEIWFLVYHKKWPKTWIEKTETKVSEPSLSETTGFRTFLIRNQGLPNLPYQKPRASEPSFALMPWKSETNLLFFVFFLPAWKWRVGRLKVHFELLFLKRFIQLFLLFILNTFFFSFSKLI